MVRIVFDEELRAQEAPSLRVMERITKNLARGRVVRDGEGYHVMDPYSPGGEFYFHSSRERYLRLIGRQLMHFPGGYRLTQALAEQMPVRLQQHFSRFMAKNEGEFLDAATTNLPEDILAKVSAENVEPGAWGKHHYEATRRRASRDGITIEECLARTVPVYTIVNGQLVLWSPLRASRLPPDGLEREIWSSHFFGHGRDGNPDAVTDMLSYRVKSGKLNIPKMSIDDVAKDPAGLASLGIGPMIEGYGKVLSLDTVENNKAHAAVLDHPLTEVASLRDLSALGLAGVKAISIMNLVSPFVSQIGERLVPHLKAMGYSLNGSGQHRVAWGFAGVTYSTDFERSFLDKSIDGYEAILMSTQLAVNRIIDAIAESGLYERITGKHGPFKREEIANKVAVVVGQNSGRPATSGQWHTQFYVIFDEELVALMNSQQRVRPTNWNTLYEDGGFRIVAAGYGNNEIQLRTDGDNHKRSFIHRERDEIRSLARAMYLNELALYLISTGSRDRVEFLRGGDLVSAMLSPEEKRARIGFGEKALGLPIVSSSQQVVPITTPLSGNFDRYVRDCKQALYGFLSGKLTLK